MSTKNHKSATTDIVSGTPANNPQIHKSNNPFTTSSTRARFERIERNLNLM